MGNSLRCCLACMLPCGALDVVRIVHLNGQFEEYGRPVSAGEILAANPNHVLSKPCSSQGVIMVVSADSELKRGHIYFLIPTSSLPEKNKKKKKQQQKSQQHVDVKNTTVGNLQEQDSYLAEKLAEKKSGHRGRRRSGARVGVWRPHLDSISEEL